MKPKSDISRIGWACRPTRPLGGRACRPGVNIHAVGGAAALFPFL